MNKRREGGGLKRGLNKKIYLFMGVCDDISVQIFINGPIHALQSQVTKIGRKTTSALGSQNTLLTRPGRNKIWQN